MLTPQDIKEKTFSKAVFGGYDMAAVDDFLEQVNDDYANLFKENAILKSKIKVLVEKVEEYRSTEDAMRMALLTAQRMSDDIIEDAKKKSDAMLKETEEEILHKRENVALEFADADARLNAARDETDKFVRASEEIMKQHAEFLSKLQSLTQFSTIRSVRDAEPEEPAEAPAAEEAAPAEEEPFVEDYTAPAPAEEPEEAPVEEAYEAPAEEEPAAEAEPAAEEPVIEEEAPAESVYEEPAAAEEEAPVEEAAAPAEEEPAVEADVDMDVTLKEIDKLVSDAMEEPVPEEEAPIQQTRKYEWTEEDELTTPRPKFDFDNLKFGSNYFED